MKKDKNNFELFDEINEQINNYYSSYGNALYNASRQRSFGYGDSQWTDETKTALRNLKLPPLQQNIISKHIKSAVAEFSANVPSLEVAAMDNDTSALKVKAYQAIIHGDIMRKGKETIIKSYEEILRTGLSAGIYLKTEYMNNSDFMQKIELEFIDYQSLYFDYSASDPTKCDGEYIGYLKRISKDEFKKRYQDYEPVDIDVQSYQGTNNDSWVFRSNDDQVILAHHFKKCHGDKKTIYKTSYGMIIDDKNNLMEGDEIIDEREVVETTVKSYILNGKQILEEKEFPIDELPIVVAQGYQAIIDGQIFPKSFGTELEDMQRLNNMMLTQVGGMVLYMRKNTTIWPKEIVSDTTTFNAIKNNAEQKDLFIDLKDTPPPIRWNAQELPTSLLQLYDNVATYMDNTLGRYESSQGSISSQKSGLAASMEISQSNLPIYYYITPITQALDKIGYLLKNLIPKIYIESRVVKYKDDIFRINNENDANSLSFMGNDDYENNYDISVKASASFEIQRQTYLNNMITIYQASPPELKTLLATNIFSLMKLPNLSEINDIYDKFIALSNPTLYPILKEKDPQKVKFDIEQMQQIQQQTQQEQQAMIMQKEQLDQQLKIKEMELQERRLNIEEAKLQLQQQKQHSDNISSLGKYQIENEKIDQKKQENMAKMTSEAIKADAEIKKASLGSSW